MRQDKFIAPSPAIPLKPRGSIGDDADDDSIVVEGHKALVPDGIYQARYIGHDTAIMFGRASKVFLKFEVVGESEYPGVRLIRPYRVLRLVGKPGPDGKFVLSASGDLYRTLAHLLDTRTRPDRISLRPLRHMLFRVRTRTVDHDRNGIRLPVAARYSVITDVEDGR